MQDQDDGFENVARDELIQELRENLARCRKVLLDENLDLKTPRTMDTALQQYLNSPQPSPQRQTDERLGKKNAGNRRISEGSKGNLTGISTPKS